MNRIDSLYLACIHDGLSKQASEYSHNPFIVQAIEQEYLEKEAGIREMYEAGKAFFTRKGPATKEVFSPSKSITVNNGVASTSHTAPSNKISLRDRFFASDRKLRGQKNDWSSTGQAVNSIASERLAKAPAFYNLKGTGSTISAGSSAYAPELSRLNKLKSQGDYYHNVHRFSNELRTAEAQGLKTNQAINSVRDRIAGEKLSRTPKPFKSQINSGSTDNTISAGSVIPRGEQNRLNSMQTWDQNSRAAAEENRKRDNVQKILNRFNTPYRIGQGVNGRF